MTDGLSSHLRPTFCHGLQYRNIGEKWANETLLLNASRLPLDWIRNSNNILIEGCLIAYGMLFQKLPDALFKKMPYAVALAPNYYYYFSDTTQCNITVY